MLTEKIINSNEPKAYNGKRSHRKSIERRSKTAPTARPDGTVEVRCSLVKLPFDLVQPLARDASPRAFHRQPSPGSALPGIFKPHEKRK